MDNITKYLIRFLKNKKIYKTVRELGLDKPYINCYVNTINPFIFFKNGLAPESIFCTASFELTFNVKKYKENDFFKKNIVVYDIKNYDKFKNFLLKNGIVWSTNTIFNDDDVEIFTKISNEGMYVYFMIDVKDTCKLYHGSYRDNDASTILNFTNRIILNEEQFYDYYTESRKKLNENIKYYFNKN